MRRYSFAFMAAMPLSPLAFSSREKQILARLFRFSHTGSPSRVTVPRVAGFWADRMDSRVVFPAPLRPIRP
jgi:hypothetical protein